MCISDIPRACGEHSSISPFRTSLRGSSPRLRGTQHALVAVTPFHGIIPALAGNTCRSWRESGAAWDHPRACGEHWDWISQNIIDPGSSPRLRGTLLHMRQLWPKHGIIPALAGNTTIPVRCLHGARDHPRACGEHHRGWVGSTRMLGSSPRLRGTHALDVSCRPPVGIIPALAGNTRCVTRSRTR